MELIYLGDLFPSIASYKKVIEKYDKGIKEGEFNEKPLGGDIHYPNLYIFLLKKKFFLSRFD